MELKEFIKTNLLQINDAIKEIKKENDELAISIVPHCKRNFENNKTIKDYDELDFVEFDVAVDTTKKGGVNISNVISGKLENKTINKIKFRIPVVMGMKQYNNKND